MIGEELFGAYAGAIDANAELLARAVESLASRLESSPPSADPAEAVAAAYAALVAEYGSYAAEIACDFYALARDEAGAAGSFEPEMGGGPDGALIADDARRAFEAHPDAPSALRSLAGTAVQRAMQRADATVSANAARDPARPKWALVPQAGACGFCVMLSSNGFAYASKATAHPRHPSCRCRPVADFDAANPSLRGYDPGAMQDAYRKCRDAVEADAREKWGAMSAGERAKWASSGRGGWDHYLRNRVAAEMDSRDRDWLQTGKACGVGADSEWNADESATAALLSRQGFAVEGIARSLKYRDRKPDFMLNGVPWEMKNPKGNGFMTIRNQFKKAVYGSSDIVNPQSQKLVISNVGNAMDFGRLCDEIDKVFSEGAFLEIAEVIAVGRDGELVRRSR